MWAYLPHLKLINFTLFTADQLWFPYEKCPASRTEIYGAINKYTLQNEFQTFNNEHNAA